MSIRRDNHLLRTAIELEDRAEQRLQEWHIRRAIHTNANRQKTPTHRAQYVGALPADPCEV